MKKLSAEEINKSAELLADKISKLEEVQEFKQAEKKISENERISKLIKEIKNLQKQAVNLKYIDKKEALKLVEEELAKLEEELNSIPVVEQFHQAQAETNDFLQLIVNTISKGVNDEINLQKDKKTS